MRYLIDSNILSDFYEQSSVGYQTTAAKFSALKALDTVSVSILTIYEFEYGCAKAPEDKKPEIRRRIETAQKDFEILTLTIEAARTYGELKGALVEARGLDKKKSRLHNIDLMLAATAINEEYTLVSSDAIYSELQKFNDALIVENWLADSSL